MPLFQQAGGDLVLFFVPSDRVGDALQVGAKYRQ